MFRTRSILVIAATLTIGGLWWFGSADQDEVDFNRDIRPILNETCVVCHGGVRREAELSLLFRADALRPAESGKPAIVPNRAGRSEIIRRVNHSNPKERMPLEQPPLSEREISLLEKWIDAGAPWEPHWAYVAPSMPELPEVGIEEWPINGIDRFVLARLEREDLAPSPQADCAVLLRRVHLDLVGLPPAPEEAEAFCRDPSNRNYETVVDSLLASPAFGERWAAYWLDLARYADSNGYEKDTPRTIWTYRDWVIRAFNADMPFDRVSTEQLAGDLIPEAGVDQLLATAFHRNTMTNTEGGTDDEEFRTAAVIDRLNTTFEIWQGTTIGCVQCHGHPYDPIRHEEFFELLAFFNNTADADRDDNEPLLYLFGADEQRLAERRMDGGHSADDRIEDRRAAQEVELGRALVAELDSLDDRMRSAVDADSLARWTRRFEAYARDGERPPRFDGFTIGPHQIRIAQKDASRRSPHERTVLRELFMNMREEFEAFRRERARLRAAIRELEPVTTPIMKELPPDAARTTHVFERGNWLLAGEREEPGVPESLPALPPDTPRNRLGLAQWLFAPENPLTARVTVNRFWEQLFGAGLVTTVEDFGTQGEKPSHPELLDWLALRFSDELGWSVKGLLKTIVMSATYRQSSRITPELLDVDPENRLLARGPRFRLSAEQIRDQALAVSGLLSRKMYGPSVFPPQPPGLWTNPYSDLTWQTSEGEDRYRRALYTYWRRTVPYPSLLTFDAPTRELCVSRRIRTNTPLQSLVTLNDPVYVEAAVALARRMHEGPSVEAQLRRGYRLALQRDPSPEALQSLVRLYEGALAEFRRRPADAAALLDIKNNAFAEYEEASNDAAYPAARKVARNGTNEGAGDASSSASSRDLDASQGPPELGALAVSANAILNLDAFLTRE